MVTLKPSLDAAQIPLTRKLILRGELDKLQDRVKELNKVSSLSNQTRAMDDALRCAESALQSCCVVRSDVGLDVKAIRKAVSAIMAKGTKIEGIGDAIAIAKMYSMGCSNH
ncbi:hypothetical protein SELMODRAFT_427666 [Selaginella moellendorffii]|uniref:Uncharacterized protein n=1 Tax=Selaginella moellendorffii TaxID=88036 RepID=D8T0B9_SELML|nr:hypothetical protein SELMODRAFT_427666 [Selaginella moellendorffii]